MADSRDQFVESLINNVQRDSFNYEFLNELQETALKNLGTINFPTKKDEEWRFLSLRDLGKESFSTPKLTDINKNIVRNYTYTDDAHTLVFVDSIFQEDLSSIGALPDGVTITTFREASEVQADELETHLGKYAYPENDLFMNINTANFNDGVIVCLPAGCNLEHPIHVVNISTSLENNFLNTSRVLVLANKDSKATLIEDSIGLGHNLYMNIPVSEFFIDSGAHVKHIRVQRESNNAYHFNRVGAKVSEKAHYDSYSIQLGAKISRNDIKADIIGENANCTLDGLVLLNGIQVSDTHTVMHHQQPNCESHQLHKVIVDGEAHSVFNGKIWVDQIAQKTDSFQENRNILLSDNGTINTKPQLEIFADDVVCSHGATIGQLDEEELFYMKSRGINDARAKELLIVGYALDIINNVELSGLRDQLEEEVRNYSEGVTESLVN